MATTWYVSTTGNDGHAGTSVGTAFLTIAHAVSVAASYDTIGIQSGTYVFSSPLTTTLNLTWVGFHTTLYDNGTKPLITTTTNSTDLFHLGNHQVFWNVVFSNAATTSATGIFASANLYLTMLECTLDGFLLGIDGSNGAGFPAIICTLYKCVISNCATAGVRNYSPTLASYCVFKGNGIGVDSYNSGTSGPEEITLHHCQFTANSTAGVRFLNSPLWLRADFCSFAFNTGDAVLFTNTANGANICLTNCIFWGNSGWDLDFGTAVGDQFLFYAQTCAYGSNTLGSFLATNGTNGIALSVSPFVNSANLALNTTAGGGVLLVANGFPPLSADGNSASFPDVNFVQGASAPPPPPVSGGSILVIALT